MGWTGVNEKIKALYGNYCLWSWMRYWFLESAEAITLMLIDKGYYDYDYERPGKDWETYKNLAKTDDELKERLGKMGFGKRKPSAEELQREIMNKND